MTHAAVSRRNVLRLGLATSAGLLASSARRVDADDPTPAQPEGPFHPIRQGVDSAGQPIQVDQRILRQLDTDSDLTFVDGGTGTAMGQVVYITGQVLDETGAPLDGAFVEIWQACISGKYNHRADPNTDWLDPDFQYWGRTATDANGRYGFRTIVPGAYRAANSWIRPPHVHFKVSRRGFRSLTTQMYFENVRFYYGRRFWSPDYLPRLNRADQILDNVPQRLRPIVVSQAREPLPGEPVDADERVCPFNVVLEQVQVGAGLGTGFFGG